MIQADRLKAGDSVGLIATSFYIDYRKLVLSIDKIKSMNLKPILGKTCTQKYKYFAGDDETRANDINEMFMNKNIKAIFVLRGGYGAQNIIDKIDFDCIKNNPKIFSGYSDVTVIHNVINQKCGLITYHSPMFGVELYKDNVDEITIKSFLDSLFIDKKEYYIDHPQHLEIKSLIPGDFKGILTGGNLSVITSSLGTFYEIDTNEKILFLEDVNEEPYKIESKLIQLKNAKKFDNIKGIILGHWSNCVSSNQSNFTIEEVFKRVLLPLNKPCIYNFTCGHELPNITLPLGSMVSVTDNKIKISY